MSFDGLGADALARQTGLTAFERLARDGTSARVIPVNPTLTAVTHMSMLTGADPQKHGIVSNRFHIAGTPPEQTAHGIMTEPDVETLVEAARRQGKRVGTVPFPNVDARSPRRTADFGLVWTTSLTKGQVLKLTRAEFRREWVPPGWTARPQRRTSFSSIMRARMEWNISPQIRADVDVVAYDTTDDRTENYDVYAVESDDRELGIDARGWFAIMKDQHGSWSKILTADPSLGVTIYWGPISRTNAYPQSYRSMLDGEVGFWPGEPDDDADIDAQTFAEQMERLADFLTRAQTLTIRRMEFDLLLAYQPIVDEAMHNFLGHDDGVIRRAFAAADRALGAVGAELDANRDALIVTGDHGLVAIERQVRLGRWLADNGFAPRWRVFVANHVAHFYRFEGADDSDALASALAATGHFERVEKKSDAFHRHSGDVMAVSYPPITLSTSSTEPVVDEPDAYGHHGALNTHRELHTVLFAGGTGVPRGNVGEVSQTKIARFVAELLGIAPPTAAE